MYRLVDTHAHLDEAAGPAAAIEEAKDAGLAAVVSEGMGYQSNYRVLELAARFPGFVYPALGLHPWQLDQELPTLDRSLAFIEDHIGGAVAIGEVGLDYAKRVREKAEKDTQKAVLKELLALAKKHDKPVSLHSRYAWPDSLSLVRDSGVARVVFHWFTGFSQTLAELISAGYFISATPAAEYHHEHRRALREAPLSRILLETDSPVQYGREVKYTSGLKDIVRSLAALKEIKGVSEATVAAETTQNAAGFFTLPGLSRSDLKA